MQQLGLPAGSGVGGGGPPTRGRRTWKVGCFLHPTVSSHVFAALKGGPRLGCCGFSWICALYTVVRSQPRRHAAIPQTGHKKPGLPAVSLSPAVCKAPEGSGGSLHHGESGMEMRVHLKICEGCGCLWFRAQSQVNVYCRDCETKLKDFPSPESRRRRGPRPRKALRRVWAVAETAGGAR